AQGLQFLEADGIILLRRQAEIGEGHRIKVVVGQGYETEAQAAQLHDFLDHSVRGTLPGPLAIRPPDRTKGTMLGTAADGLHRGPHVILARHQVPARGQETATLDATAMTKRLSGAFAAVRPYQRPDQVALARHHGTPR